MSLIEEIEETIKENPGISESGIKQILGTKYSTYDMNVNYYLKKLMKSNSITRTKGLEKMPSIYSKASRVWQYTIKVKTDWKNKKEIIVI